MRYLTVPKGDSDGMTVITGVADSLDNILLVIQEGLTKVTF